MVENSQDAFSLAPHSRISCVCLARALIEIFIIFEFIWHLLELSGNIVELIIPEWTRSVEITADVIRTAQ